MAYTNHQGYMMISWREKKKSPKGKKRLNIKLSRPELEKGLKNFVAKTSTTIDEIYNHIALVETIEKKYFGSMQMVSRDPKNPTGTIGRALTTIQKLIETHNGYFQGVVEAFSQFRREFTEFKFNNLESFLLNPQPKVDEKWVEEKMRSIEKRAGVENA